MSFFVWWEVRLMLSCYWFWSINDLFLMWCWSILRVSCRGWFLKYGWIILNWMRLELMMILLCLVDIFLLWFKLFDWLVRSWMLSCWLEICLRMLWFFSWLSWLIDVEWIFFLIRMFCCCWWKFLRCWRRKLLSDLKMKLIFDLIWWLVWCDKIW